MAAVGGCEEAMSLLVDEVDEFMSLLVDEVYKVDEVDIQPLDG